MKKGEDYVKDLTFVDSYCRGWIVITFEIRIWITMELLLHLYLNYGYLDRVIFELVFVFEFLRS